MASGRDVSVADDVLAPGYVNVAYEGVDIAGVKAMHTALSAAGVEFRISDLELVAEGDAVSARFDYGLTLPDGSEPTSRVLAYYHLTGGQIDVNDVNDGAGAARRPRAAHGAATNGPVDPTSVSVWEERGSSAVEEHAPPAVGGTVFDLHQDSEPAETWICAESKSAADRSRLSS